MGFFSDVKKSIDKAIPKEVKNTVKGTVLNPIFGGGAGALKDIYNAIKGGGGSSSSSKSSSGGGESGAHGGMEFGSAFSMSSSDIFKQLLKYAPKLAEMQYGLDTKYQPLQAQLALDLNKQFQGQQLTQELGIEKEFLPQFQSLYQDQRTIDRGGDISDVEAYASRLPGIREASEDPAATALRKMLMGQVTDELSAGTRLTADQLREVNQNVRSSLQARGIEGGDTAAAREAIARAMAGQSLLTSRQGKAQSLLAQEASQQADPFLAILSRPSTALSAGNNQMNAGMSQPVQTTPYSQPFDSAFNVIRQGSANATSSIQAANDNRAYALARLQAMQNGIIF